MASISPAPPTASCRIEPRDVVFQHPHVSNSKSITAAAVFSRNKFPRISLSSSSSSYRLTTPRSLPRASSTTPASTCHSYDVVVVGAGIIGLTIARQLLLESDLSVAVVDQAAPCSGATGAGQGYIWLVHKSTESATWDLTLRSRRLWEEFAEGVRNQGLDPLQELGWRKTGSLLVGRTAEESEALRTRVKKLSEAGISVEFLDSRQLHSEEPELGVGEDGGAAFLPDDCQLDAHSTVSFLLNFNRTFSSKGRYTEFFHEPVTGFVRSGSGGEVEAVRTCRNTLYVKKAVVVATGCWSGSVMHGLFRDMDVGLDVPVKPRKGYLLVLENICSLNLKHGLMEAGYVGHKTAVTNSNDSTLSPVDHEQMLSVSMTATMDTSGNLVIGSSRQFAGFCSEIDESIINQVWNHAKDFFPKLKEYSLKDFSDGRKVRVGLRPYMPDGRPVIGLVPALSNTFVAAGHEGEGLCLALGTAEMMVDMVLGKPGLVNDAAFAFRV